MTTTTPEASIRKSEALDYAEAFYAKHQVTAAGVRAWALENVEGFTAKRGAISREVLDSYGAAFPVR